MNNTHQVISAFLDNESFDLRDLAAALDDPAGRATLIELIALREVIQPAEPAPPLRFSASGRAGVLRLVAAAAVVLGALVGGYTIGEHQAGIDSAEAPQPARVIEATTSWQTSPGGVQ